MDKFDVELLKSINGVKFGSKAAEVHKVFGEDFKKNDRELDDSDKEYLMKIAQRMSEMSGRPIEDFTKYIDKDEDFERDSSDYYSFCRIDYDENDSFECIEIYSDQSSQLIVDGKDFSSFDLKSLLSLADDFVEEEKGTSYTSYTKQIGIWCPDGDGRVECILFGKPGYYQE